VLHQIFGTILKEGESLEDYVRKLENNTEKKLIRYADKTGEYSFSVNNNIIHRDHLIYKFLSYKCTVNRLTISPNMDFWTMTTMKK